MTFRAIIVGLIGAALVCGFGYFNDAVLRQTYMVGNSLPISVYGSFIILVLLINPLLGRIWKKLSLSGVELAVILTLTLSACCIPGSGLMRTFTATLVMPFNYNKTTAAWSDQKVLTQVPSYMLVDVNDQNENTVLNPFAQGGLGIADKHITLAQVPWKAWTRTLIFWVPLILVLWTGLIGLALVVHRQWADHEQLPYPIATFANALIPEGKSVIAETFRNKLFWIGAVVVMLIHFNNFATLWYPDVLIQFPRTLDFNPLTTLFTTINKGGGWSFFRPTFFFSVIAFSFFLPTDVSLSLGIGPLLWFTVVGMLAGYGITTGWGGASDGNITNFIAFGAYVGFFCVLIYTGRRYYSDVFRSALFLRKPTAENGQSVWGARVFLAAMLFFVIYTSTLTGLDWQMGTLFVVLMTLIFLVISRLVAETGIFFVQANFTPIAILTGIFGYAALGPKTILLLMMLSMVFLVDPRESLMPFVLNSFKLLDFRKANTGKASALAVVALLLGMAIAIPATLYFQYDRGSNRTDEWATRDVPSFPFNSLVSANQRLESQGLLEQSTAVTGWGHFSHISPPNSQALIACFIGIALVVLFTMARLRFARWPLHPVLFLIWTTYPGANFFASFLAGWAVKTGVMKTGGASLYRNAKPLMFGIIAGEMLAGALIMLFGYYIYKTTGQPPQSFWLMPG